MELTPTTPHESNKSVTIGTQCYNAFAQLHATLIGSRDWRSVASASRLWDSLCMACTRHRLLCVAAFECPRLFVHS